MKVPIVENVLKLNDEVAALNRGMFREAGAYVIDLIGAPGCGKTTLLCETISQMREEMTFGVCVGDLATTRDGERLMRVCPHVVQINTGKGCHLDANQVRQAAAQLPLESIDILVIENVGNLICPVGFDLGQDAMVGMFNLTGGDDKAAKHPHLTAAAAMLLVNQSDLAAYVPFDMARFTADVRRLNRTAPLVEVCALRGRLDGWVDWLRSGVRRREAAVGRGIGRGASPVAGG